MISDDFLQNWGFKEQVCFMVHKYCYTIYLENNHWQTLKWFAIYSDNVIILGKFELRSVIVSALFPILFNWLLEVSEWDEIKKTDIGNLQKYLFTYYYNDTYIFFLFFIWSPMKATMC